MASEAEARSFELHYEASSQGRARLQLYGRLTFAAASQLWAEAREHVDRPARGEALASDMAGVEYVDGGAMALLVHLRTGLQQRGVASEFVGAPARIQEIIHLYRGDVRPGRRRRRK